MAQKLWSNEETQQVIELHKTLTLTQIGQEMGRSKDSVRHRLQWLKEQAIPKAPVTIRAVKEEEVRQQKEVIKEPKPLRKKEVTERVYPQLEYCEVHHCLVSNWEDHRRRLSGCTRPMA